MNDRQHRLSAVFPPLSEEEFSELRSDIAENGLQSPIVGHGQTKRGGNLPISSTIEEVADALNVSERSVKDARIVLDSGDADLIAKVESGEVAVSKAARDVRASTAKPTPVKRQELAAAAVVMPQTVSQWNALTDSEQQAHLAHRDPKAKLNRQKDGEDENRIDWARWTWNPVTGCNHSCPYCYARDIAERFVGTAGFPNGFEPTLRADRLLAPLNFAPGASDDPREKRIFTGSMTDLFGRWVPAEWINAVLDVCRQAPQWDFLMLTKFPKRMAEFDIPNNVWMGTSVDCQARVAAAEAAFKSIGAKVRWLSCEPMIEPLKFKHLDRFELVVIGGGSRSSKTPRWIPPFAWIGDLMAQADTAGCNVFLKSNIYRKEEPGGRRYVFADRAPEVFHYLSRASAPDQQANAA
jgi:protein gp37